MNKNMKLIKIVSLVLLLSFVIGIASSCAKTEQPAATASATSAATTAPATAPVKTAVALNGEIKVGVSLGISGSVAAAAARSKQGAELAAKEINAAGGILGKKLVLDIQDDQSTADGAVVIASKFSGEDIVAMVGPMNSSQVLAINDTLKTNKMISLVLGSSPKIGLTQTGNAYMFQMRPNDQTTAKIAAEYVVSKSIKKIGILYDNDDFGNGGKDVMIAYLKTQSIEPVIQGYNSTDKDLTAQVLAFKNAQIEAIIAWGHIDGLHIFSENLYSIGFKPMVVGSSTVSQAEFAQACSAEAIANWYAICEFAPDLDEPTTKKLVASAKSEYDIVASMNYVATYGAIYTLKDAIERAKSTEKEAVAAALRKTTDLDVGFKYTCDKEQRMVHKLVLVQLDNNRTTHTLSSFESKPEL